MQNIEKTKERCACRCHLPLKTTRLCPNCFNGQCEKEEIKEDEYIKTECPNCGNEMTLPKWQFEKHKEDKDYYCSEGCRYNSETGHPAEEY